MNKIIVDDKTFSLLEKIANKEDFRLKELMESTNSSPKEVETYAKNIQNKEGKYFLKELEKYKHEIKKHIEETSKTRNYIDKKKQLEIYWNTSVLYHNF
ncbi:hypothetical protein JXM83_00100 [Candidatus Woesearchaeota archaeon]|nr:hypothetical protein [Candidatus Woesearchaeota archaeon]